MDEKMYFIEWHEPSSNKWHKEYVILTSFERDRLLSYFEDHLGQDYSVEPAELQPILGFDALAMRYGWGK